MAGFKDHPLYVLARHLKRDEVVEPAVELGKFRGEPVYPRGNVLALKTAENWMRQGRTVVVGAQPLKWVKQRAVTVSKKRAIEVALSERRERRASGEGGGVDEDGDGGGGPGDGGGDGFGSSDGVLQGLYAAHQTELYRPPPVVDVSRSRSLARSLRGRDPLTGWDLAARARCRRTTLATSTCTCRPCCPRGRPTCHVRPPPCPPRCPGVRAHRSRSCSCPDKGIAKLARQLGFDYAEAVVRARRPI